MFMISRNIVISLSLALIHQRYVTEYSDMQCISFISLLLVYLYAAPLLRLAPFMPSLSFILAVSLDHVHTLRTLIPKVFSSSLFPPLFFVHFTLLADSRAFSLVLRFPTKSESPYLARKKKFYHSVSTCSSTSFSLSVVCRLSEHCRRIIVFLPSIVPQFINFIPYIFISVIVHFFARYVDIDVTWKRWQNIYSRYWPLCLFTLSINM